MSGTLAGDPAADAQPVTSVWAHGEDCPFPDATLTGLILDQARRTPGAEAIRQWDHVLTYAGLIDAAESVAVKLRQAGVRPETRVGICLRRTLALPVAVLGVWLAGGAYVPLDHNHPQRRLLDILQDAGAGIALVDEPGAALLAGCGRRLIEVAQPPGSPAREPAAPPRVHAAGGVHPLNAAYVMYTSGSTGQPKGVTVSHRNLVAFCAAAHACSPLRSGCRSAGFSSLAFDAFVFDVYVPLTLGAAVQLVPDEDRVDAARLARFLREHRVTRSMLPPAVLPLLNPADLPDLADIYVAGEPCGPEQVERWTAAGRGRFHNWYGPTETTVIVISADLEGSWVRPLPIGGPLPGCRAWVVDEDMRACPQGVPGELLIGGPQLARGYLGMPGHTAERFVPDPFDPAPGARLYRTGDLVRWEADGTLAYMGRLDRQVKIQGQRVEIGELETVLQAHPAVGQAVADVATGPAGLKHLVAYVTPAGVPGLRAYCAARLPVYMTPAHIYRLDSFPLNVSGKTDLAALRALVAKRQAGQSALGSPSAAQGLTPEDLTPEDRLVAEVWAGVFEGPEPGPDEEFTASGGHSLLAMRLVAALRARSGRQLGIDDVYQSGTVAGLAAVLREAPPLGDDEAVPTGSPAALSAAQRRMWFVEQLAPGSPVHNVPMSERMRGPLDVSALQAALHAIEQRHAALRWRLVATDGMPRVDVAAAGQISLRLEDLSSQPEADREVALRGLLEREAGIPFEPSTAPLWRATLIRLAAREHVLAITAHHVVFDGWSRDVLYAGIGRAYRAALAGEQAGPPPAVGYADYVAWSARYADRESSSSIAWWLKHLDGAPLVLDLPRDAPRPAVRTFSGAMAEAAAGPAVSAAVRAVARQAEATPFAVLLAAFAQLASRLTGQDDLIIGTPVADRGNVAFEQVIGLCLHMLPLRFTVSHEAGFAEHVRRCRDELAAARAHPNAPLERIVEALGQSRDLSRNPVFQVLFNGYDLVGSRLDLPGLDVTPVLPGLPGALFDLTLYVSERDEGRFGIRAVYNPGLYSAARVDALLASYLALLAALTADPERPAGTASARPDGCTLPGEHTALPGWAGPGVLERVRATVAGAPATLAATGPGGPLSYAGLAALADRTAAALLDAGVAAGDAVAVLAERDARLPAILLGVLATGARWLVLDPLAGDPRMGCQIGAARASALIRFPAAMLPADLDPGLPVLDAATLAGEAAPAGGEGPQAQAADAEASARGYLSLTSGTTGEPKPVLTPERPLAHFLDWYARTFGLGAQDRFAMLSGLAHDPLLRDVFTPLVLGGCLCVPEQGLLRDPASLARWLHAQQVTVTHLTPQAARMLTTAAGAGALPLLRLVALAGDMATAADAARVRAIAPHARIVNFYGTTETPQVQAWNDLGTGEINPGLDGMPLPVGHGIDGAQLLVTSRHGGAAGVGELGEVTIRSRYLATGYAVAGPAGSRFIPAAGQDAQDRRFATGDLGRYRPDGTVVLAGRGDGQLKIRGFRVELGEVEAVLAAHPGVREACVTAIQGPGERQLWAYVVPAAAGLATARLMDHLRANLPEYAVPAGVSLLRALPLTANGKVDRQALRRPAPSPERGPAAEFSTSTERLIAQVWSEVLGVARLRVTDNFFEVGGHSLAIVAVQARLTRTLGRDIPVVDLFSYPAIRSLAAHLDGTDGNGRDEGLERAALRAAQRRDRARRRSTRQSKGVSS